MPDNPEDLEVFINEQENSASNIKEGARAAIVWANPEQKNRTEYSIIYLHGFKANHREGDPVHREIAQSLGSNLYLTRLEGHGLNIDEPLKDLSPSSFEESAHQALAVGKRIGNKVIIMGTSTGGSLGIYLAGQPEFNTGIKALILYSPLIKFYGISQWLLGNKFSRTALRVIPGKNYILKSDLGSSEAEKKIWYDNYALQGALALGEFVQKNMTPSTFSKVRCPVFTGYYYRNRGEQDKVVSVSAIKKMFRTIATPESKKTLKNFPEARTHVISSGLVSKCIEEVKNESIQFLELIL